MEVWDRHEVVDKRGLLHGAEGLRPPQGKSHFSLGLSRSMIAAFRRCLIVCSALHLHEILEILQGTNACLGKKAQRAPLRQMRGWRLSQILHAIGPLLAGKKGKIEEGAQGPWQALKAGKGAPGILKHATTIDQTEAVASIWPMHCLGKDRPSGPKVRGDPGIGRSAAERLRSTALRSPCGVHCRFVLPMGGRACGCDPVHACRPDLDLKPSALRLL